jgi:hypothetical protein
MPLPWIIVVLVLWAAVVYALLVASGLSRRLAQIEERADEPTRSQLDAIAAGPQIGEPLPELPGHPELGSARVAGSGWILLLVSSSCGPCLTLIESLEAAAAEGHLERALADVDLIVVTDPAGEERARLVASARVVVQRTGEISDRLGVRVTPFAIAMDREAVVAVGLPQSASDIAELAAGCRRSVTAHRSSRDDPNPRDGGQPSDRPPGLDHQIDEGVRSRSRADPRAPAP